MFVLTFFGQKYFDFSKKLLHPTVGLALEGPLALHEITQKIYIKIISIIIHGILILFYAPLCPTIKHNAAIKHFWGTIKLYVY